MSPCLRPFVAARINPIRFSEAEAFDFNDVLDRMQKAAVSNVASNVEALEKHPARGHTVARACFRFGVLTRLPRFSLSWCPPPAPGAPCAGEPLPG
jgi:hypothetical protein